MASFARATRSGVELGAIAVIGVIADPEEQSVVREFFELFKTPWEFYRGDGQYDVLLCAGDAEFTGNAKVVLLYAGRKVHFDEEQKIETGQRRKPSVLSHQRNRIPIYGDSVTFPKNQNSLLTDEDQECAAYLDESGNRVFARIGYDLFREVHRLLTVGQPVANAHLPALELHIGFLRDLVIGCGIPLVEIPPAPAGYQFAACLTHDVDHPAVRQHKWDHTMFGFLYRAIFDSFRRLIRGKMSIQDLLRNWAAALKLPFVHLGLAKDFWREFDERYLELEKGLHSTYFVIPFGNRPGGEAHGPAPAIRATRYGARDIADAIGNLTAAGCEVGLHGIDAWLDASAGRLELEEIRLLTGASEIGVRMHWLYFGQQSPVVLELAGATYDSTVGYNQTVGYRAGTTQVFKPLNSKRLLELPLHVMDTALFYPSNLALSPKQASGLLHQMVDNAVHFGGAMTINWHDRSLAPERLWGASYVELIQELKSRGAWFATAGQATSWFRKRRAAAFVTNSIEPSAVRAKVAVERGDDLPGLRLRIHKARKSAPMGAHRSEEYVDIAVDETAGASAPSETRR
jgi:peptidoglycan/xylan/chitin deacetylase (PgdA/CDA1 family)